MYKPFPTTHHTLYEGDSILTSAYLALAFGVRLFTNFFCCVSIRIVLSHGLVC